MSVGFEVENNTSCSDCGNAIGEGDSCYCQDCLDAYRSDLDDMQEKYEDLQYRLDELQEELNRLKNKYEPDRYNVGNPNTVEELK